MKKVAKEVMKEDRLDLEEQEGAGGNEGLIIRGAFLLNLVPRIRISSRTFSTSATHQIKTFFFRLFLSYN